MLNLWYIFHRSIKMWPFQTWEAGTCKQGKLGHGQLFSVFVCTAADINPGIGDKLKGDTKKKIHLGKTHPVMFFFFLPITHLCQNIILKSVVFWFSAVIFSRLVIEGMSPEQALIRIRMTLEVELAAPVDFLPSFYYWTVLSSQLLMKKKKTFCIRSVFHQKQLHHGEANKAKKLRVAENKGQVKGLFHTSCVMEKQLKKKITFATNLQQKHRKMN